jgi:uncharacterized membrane protein YdjX (TVP38/TMEM64 family)
VYFVATVLFIPGALLTLGAGFAFGAAFGLGLGLLLGSIAVLVGASSGAIASFFLARFLLRDSIQSVTKKYAVAEAVDISCHFLCSTTSEGYRQSPSVISRSPLTLSPSMQIPGTVLYVFVGTSAGSLTESMSMMDDNKAVTYVIIGFGIIMGIAAIWVTTYYARKELRKILAARQAAPVDASVDPSVPIHEEVESIADPGETSEISPV